MTNEEAKKIISKERDGLRANPLVKVEDCLYEAFDVAIKALEQEPILAKIRTEIDRQHRWLLQAGINTYNADIAFDAIKAVIAESEVSE